MRTILFCLALLGAVVGRGQIVLDWYGSAAPAAGLLLDDYGGAAAAYSLRLLRTAYTGNCIEVRRSNDNALQNIGFAGGVVDTAALKTFCGANDCFVTTWYDQSGNAQNLTQTTAAQQPQIVSSGVVSRGVNGQIGLSGGSGRWMQVPSSTVYFKFLHDGTNYSNVFVGQVGIVNDPGTTYLLYGTNKISGGAIGAVTWWINAGPRGIRPLVVNPPNFPISASDDWVPNTESMLYVDLDPDNATASNRALIYVNNNAVAQNNTSISAVSSANAAFNFGIMRVDLSPTQSQFTGFFHELVLWSTSQSSNRTGIQSNINSFYNIY